MEALVIVNWKYASSDYNELQYPENDGEIMKNLLREGGYKSVIVKKNVEDISKVVQEYLDDHDETLNTFHFHYSGNWAISIGSNQIYN